MEHKKKEYVGARISVDLKENIKAELEPPWTMGSLIAHLLKEWHEKNCKRLVEKRNEP